MKIITKAVLISALFVGVAFADAISERQAAMKTIGQTMKGLTAMANGDVDFDANTAKMGLMQIESAAAQLPNLYPEGSGEGETEASPAIWTDNAKFTEVLNKFVADTKVDAVPADSFELSDKLDVISTNCKACHADFRIKK